MPTRDFIERPRTFCALGGAVLTATAIPGVVPILHSSIGCGSSIYFNQLGGAGHLGAGYCGGLAVPSSNVGEREVVFGGAERLHQQIANTVRLVEAGLYVILTGCTTDIIGDDIGAEVREFAARGVPIVGAETGGFRGDGYKGYDILLQALFTQYTRKRDTKAPNKVNLWGIVPGQDAFWRGNLSLIRALLGSLGLDVNALVTDGDSLADLEGAGDASLNIVVSRSYGLGAAQTFRDTHGTPFISTPLPIGPSATTEFLRRVGAALDLPVDAVEKTISDGTSRYYHFVERIADSFNDLDFQRYAVVVGDVNYAPALTRFLADDLGWLPELTVVTDEVTDDLAVALKEDLTDLDSGYRTRLVFETDATEVSSHLADLRPRYDGGKYYDSFSPAYVIGSHLEREFARSIGAAHLTVSYPVGNRAVLSRGYTGYEGALTLIEDILAPLVAER